MMKCHCPGVWVEMYFFLVSDNVFAHFTLLLTGPQGPGLPVSIQSVRGRFWLQNRVKLAAHMLMISPYLSDPVSDLQYGIHLTPSMILSA